MKLKNIKPKSNLVSFFDNQVEKSLGKAKLDSKSSHRQHKGKSQNKFRNKNLRSSSSIQCVGDFLVGVPELMRLEMAASVLGVSPKTIYDWRYRSQQRKIPVGLFVKLNRSLLIRTSVLREWIASQNPSLQSEGI